jgi:hypothetical protein
MEKGAPLEVCGLGTSKKSDECDVLQKCRGGKAQACGAEPSVATWPFQSERRSGRTLRERCVGQVLELLNLNVGSA